MLRIRNFNISYNFQAAVRGHPSKQSRAPLYALRLEKVILANYIEKFHTP
jgi:hypothetical protein